MIASFMKSGILAENSFDVGVMFHTLDHLTHPLETLQHCVNALKSGGTMIVAVHNEKAWSARLLGKSSPIVDVEHTYLYSRKTAEALFRKAGLSEIQSGGYSNYYSLAYLLHLIPVSRRFRKWVLNSSVGLIMSKIRVRLPLGNIWVSGRKP
jgi:SAM-dependent methyltransferase